MAIAAVRHLASTSPRALDGVDLIIGGSYTPDDTLSTLPFYVQREFEIERARVYFLSTACSSFISALEMAQLMIDAGQATRALVIMSEHNSYYSDDTDRFSGHLWGDGAAAVIVSADPVDALFSLDYVSSRGVACAGKGPEAISLRPAKGSKGLSMGEGRDVFARACEHMVQEIRSAVVTLGMDVCDIDWIVPHQANLRILINVAKSLKIPMDRCIVTVDELGNTGCASIPISIEQALPAMSADDIIAMAAFGGGYSCGAGILRKI